MSLKGKTIFISGGTRGIGREIALKCAADGANIVIAAKSDTPHPKLPYTIHETAADCEKAGGQGLGIKCDIREEEQVKAAVDAAVERFGGIDILINNASAIQIMPLVVLPMKSYDLMFEINVRGTFLVTKICAPHLLKSGDGQVMNLSPPLNMHPAWFKLHGAYTTAKYAMTMAMMTAAEEFRGKGIRANALWPQTAVDTSAIRNLSGIGEHSRIPAIMAEAAYEIFTDSAKPSGECFIDETVLREKGVTDFDQYAVNSEKTPFPDLFVEGAEFIVDQMIKQGGA